ncbi:unnamed protein product [Heterobilharzia americana]|nr:unnamed protein product [Heterobilharzia americana]CAH8512302.1 unnamed protein product [Heterobilharzia americana]
MEQHYLKKALEEVVRLADEKVTSAGEIVIKKEEELREISHTYEDTVDELGLYFASVTKQLERWRSIFIQDIQKSMSDLDTEFRTYAVRIQSGIEKLKELRERSAKVLTLGYASNSDLVYQVHSCIFSINQDLEYLTEFVGNYIPLKFVGKLNFERIQKSEVGTLERLSDIVFAEILPSKLPKIKLGQLFHIDFRISRKHCEAARKFITYSVTKDDEHLQNVCAYLLDNKNGTYSLSFPITLIAPHTVNVLYLGEHIKNSPYTIVFKVGPNQMISGPIQSNPSASSFLNKDTSNEHQTNSCKVSGRPAGDDTEVYRRNKWLNHPGSDQKNNNQSTVSAGYETNDQPKQLQV